MQWIKITQDIDFNYSRKYSFANNICQTRRAIKVDGNMTDTVGGGYVPVRAQPFKPLKLRKLQKELDLE